jgi:hypothetical protein
MALPLILHGFHSSDLKKNNPLLFLEKTISKICAAMGYILKDEAKKNDRKEF